MMKWNQEWVPNQRSPEVQGQYGGKSNLGGHQLADVIAESNYADQKMKMEYDRKKLEMGEKVAKAKAKLLSMCFRWCIFAEA